MRGALLELSAGRTTPYLTISKPFVTGDGSEDIELINIDLGMRGQLYMRGQL